MGNLRIGGGGGGKEEFGWATFCLQGSEFVVSNSSQAYSNPRMQ